MKKLKVIKKLTYTPCYACNEGLYGKAKSRKKCKACKGTGRYREYMYYHIYKDKNGQEICFLEDTIK